jgi:hypothetical protein
MWRSPREEFSSFILAAGTLLRQLLRVIAVSIACIWARLGEFFSAEWILKRCHAPNGGSVILFRSLWTATALFLLALGLVNLLKADQSGVSLDELKLQAGERLHWLGAFFGAAYTALYARFASQWTYLANLFNQIKATECRDKTRRGKIAEWKVGFIEDAQEVHLASKGLYRPIIIAWARQREVKRAYAEMNGSHEKLDQLLEKLAASPRGPTDLSARQRTATAKSART